MSGSRSLEAVITSEKEGDLELLSFTQGWSGQMELLF